MKTIAFLITAEQPLLLTSLQGDPNSSVSFPYIPGSVIRGALIGRYVERHGDLHLHDPIIRRLFFDHQTRYLNAYLYAWYDDTAPERDAEGVPLPYYARSLPTPRAWLRDKYDEAKYNRVAAFDFSAGQPNTNNDDDTEDDVEDEDLLPNPPQHPPQPKSLDGEFCWLNRGQPVLFSVRRHINIHNQRDRPHGRGKEGSGTVFRYDAIAPEQTFQAVILCDNDDDATTIAGLLTPNRFWLGGSRSAGYGRVQVDDIDTLSEWHEVGTPSAKRLGSGELQVTLLSDMVVCDSGTGQHSGEFPIDDLTAHLGLTADALAPVPERTFRAMIQHGGFNRTWGLPTPQMPALAAGSIFTWRIQAGMLDANRMAGLENRGLGERRAEGFGRLAINWRPSRPQLDVRVPEWWSYHYPPPPRPSARQPDAPQPQQSQLSETSRLIAQDMARNILRQRMEQRLIELVGRHPITGELSNTQLSRLRIVARRTIGDADMSRLQQLLDTLPPTSREQFETARIGERVRLIRWLEDRIKNPKQDWGIAPVGLAGEELRVDDQLAREYTLRLIMALARQRVKEDD